MKGPEWRLPFGANLVGTRQTRFRIWAPGQQELSLTIEGREPLAMTACAGGWFEATADCGAGTRYRYLLQDGIAVPDPASRAQSDDVHGPSIVVDPAAYKWRNEVWRGRPWEECSFLRATCGHPRRLYRSHARTATPCRTRHYGGRTDADRGISWRAQLGL